MSKMLRWKRSTLRDANAGDRVGYRGINNKMAFASIRKVAINSWQLLLPAAFDSRGFYLTRKEAMIAAEDAALQLALGRL